MEITPWADNPAGLVARNGLTQYVTGKWMRMATGLEAWQTGIPETATHCNA